jgi:hypothetical protein
VDYREGARGARFFWRKSADILEIKMIRGMRAFRGAALVYSGVSFQAAEDRRYLNGIAACEA